MQVAVLQPESHILNISPGPNAGCPTLDTCAHDNDLGPIWKRLMHGFPLSEDAKKERPILPYRSRLDKRLYTIFIYVP